jgi:hypothetical protein
VVTVDNTGSPRVSLLWPERAHKQGAWSGRWSLQAAGLALPTEVKPMKGNSRRILLLGRQRALPFFIPLWVGAPTLGTPVLAVA